VDVVAGTFALKAVIVPAKPPGPIRALNPVKKSGFLQGLKCPVERHPVKGSRPFLSFEDVLVGKWAPGTGKQLEYCLPRRCPSEPAHFQKLSRRFYGEPVIPKASNERLFFMQLCCK
jgi:hypothetical protein